MLKTRIIPTLLLKGQGLVKGKQFKNHRYVGDPLNAIQIFNAKEVDEILFLDISATHENRSISGAFVQHLADQCLVPFGVGGGIRTLDQAQDVLSAGAEKVCLGTSALENPRLIEEISGRFGSQAVLVSIDYGKNWIGQRKVYSKCGTKARPESLKEALRICTEAGAGEILLQSIERDGSLQGYDVETYRQIVSEVSVPIILACGAGSYEHLRLGEAEVGANALAAGSVFVFHGPRQAVLINYPDPQTRNQWFLSKNTRAASQANAPY